jgi:hypothetical protein
VTAALIARLLPCSAEDLAVLRTMHAVDLRNWNGRDVGQLRACLPD